MSAEQNEFGYLVEQGIINPGEDHALETINQEARRQDLLSLDAYQDPLVELAETIHYFLEWRSGHYETIREYFNLKQLV